MRRLIWIAVFCIWVLKAYADLVYSGCGTNNVNVIDTTSNTVVATINTAEATAAFALTPNQKFLYIASDSDSVYAVDTSNNTVIATIDVFNDAYSIVANDQFAY